MSAKTGREDRLSPEPDRERSSGGHRDDRRRRDRYSYRHESSSDDGLHERRSRDRSDGRRVSKYGHDNKEKRRRSRSRSKEDRGARRRSRSPDRTRRPRRSRSPPEKKRRDSSSKSKSPLPRRRGPLPSQDESFRRDLKPGAAGEAPPPEKQKPNYKPTGLLAKEANTVVGTTTVLKYHEPPEARKPPVKEQWRMYVFKKQDLLDTIHLSHRSAWLAGRDQNVTDLLLDHPSISKQHAVFQFRHIATTNEFGDKQNKVKPYLIDLESANGTKLNSKAVEPSRYVELVDQDVIVFGDSEREYVLMLSPN